MAFKKKKTVEEEMAELGEGAEKVKKEKKEGEGRAKTAGCRLY
jgi:hypothetical protein